MTLFKLAPVLFGALAPALALVLAVPAAGQEPESALAQQASAERVTIPFDPPIGTPLTYALRFERKRPRADSAYDFEQRLTFARAGAGYFLRLETLAFIINGKRLELTDSRVLAAFPAAMRPFILPITVELDASGEMVRVADWEAVRAQLQGLPEAAAAASGVPLDEGGRKAAALVMAPFMNSSAEDAPALMIRGWPQVLGYGWTSYTLGETVAEAGEVAGGLSPMPIPARVEGVLTRTPEGNLRYTQTARFDSEVMRAVTLATIEAIRAQAARAGPGSAALELQAIEITDEVAITFEPGTGLPLTARTARLTSVSTTSENGVGGDIMTIRRIAP